MVQTRSGQPVDRDYAADSADSPILEEAGESGSEQKPKPLVKYGELVILGYNGYLPAGERGRRRSKFVLYRRPAANGVRRSKHYVVKTPHSSKAILDASQHSISYTLSRSQAVIVEYTEDPDTDMFQQFHHVIFVHTLAMQTLGVNSSDKRSQDVLDNDNTTRFRNNHRNIVVIKKTFQKRTCTLSHQVP
ncbi:Protein pellino [Papilio machaon]|uniref:Protein pellino n=1 Tax=Papilio machaon TaxID=76193 RepID=A0A194RL75_PAPMA|nr:Protein pellino [Papilio machaon]